LYHKVAAIELRLFPGEGGAVSYNGGGRSRLFGLLTINTFLLVGLTLLSWVATYSGLIEFVKASVGDIDWTMHIVIGVAVAMLQFMILFVLSAFFSGNLTIWLWPFFIALYLFLTAISVSFGFGFFWKYIAARSETTASAETSIIRVRAGLEQARIKLDGLQSTLTTLADISERKAEQERTLGGTCPNSPRGDGPRRQLREDDAQRFQFARAVVQKRVQGLTGDIQALEGKFAQVIKNDPKIIDPATGTRTAFMTDLNKTLNLTVSSLNELQNDSQLQNIKEQFRTRANQTSFPGFRGTSFSCPDAQLSLALNGVVRAIDELPKVENVEIVNTEGVHAVAEAINRLKNTGIHLALEFKLPPSASELRSLARQGKDVNEQSAGLGRDDVIPLTIAIFVDVCILAVAIRRDRSGGFTADKLIAILDEAYTYAFGREPTNLERILPIQGIVFDHLGSHYAAVPLDFRENKVPAQSGRRSVPAWAQTGDGARPAAGDGMTGASDSARENAPLARECQYLSNAFVAFQSEGLAKPLGGWGKLTNLVTERGARRKLFRQHSIYAKADAFRLYKFQRKAWINVMISMFSDRKVSAKEQQTSNRPSAHRFGTSTPRTSDHSTAAAAHPQSGQTPPTQPSVSRGQPVTPNKVDEQRATRRDKFAKGREYNPE
jgi:hypothetical protein